MLGLCVISVLLASELSELTTRLRTARRDEDAAAQIEALRAIALLGAEEGEARSAAHAGVLGEALREGAPEARLEAARLLPLGLHRKTATKELARTAKELRRSYATALREAGKGNASSNTRVVDGVRRPGGEAGELLDLSDAVVDALGELPGKDTQNALTGLLKDELLPGSLALRTAEALIAFGDRKSIDAVRDWLVALRRQLPDELPPETAGTGSSSSVSSSMTRDQRYRQTFPAADATQLRAARAALRERAKEQQWPAPPDEDDDAAWKSWFDDLAPRLPAKLEG